MAKTTKITLARGMKVKNRLTGRLSSLWKDITSYNSTIKGSESIDVKPLYERYNKGQELLISLKVAIATATTPMTKNLVEMSELRGLVKNLGGLITTHGIQHANAYRRVQDEKPLEYIAQFRKQDVDKLVKEYETRIDTLQEELDTFNHKATIEIDSETLSYIGAE